MLKVLALISFSISRLYIHQAIIKQKVIAQILFVKRYSLNTKKHEVSWERSFIINITIVLNFNYTVSFIIRPFL